MKKIPVLVAEESYAI